MISLWQKISKIGITNNLNLAQQNKIILLNRIVAIFSIAIWARLIFDVIDQDWVGAMIIITMGTLFSSTFVLTYFQKFKTAPSYFISIFLLVITIVNMLVGKGLGAEFSYFSIIVMSIIFFDNQSSKIFFVGLTITAYVLSQIFFHFFESPLSFILNSHSYHFMFFANLICTVLSANTFVKENKKFSQQTIELLESAKEQNIILEQTQAKLEKQNKKLESANKELEKFAYIASHDLKTPLRNINSFLDLIARKVKKENNEELLEYIGYASNSAKQMHYLIQDILEYSRLNGENFSFGEIDLNHLLPKVLKNIQGYISEKKAIVNFEILPTLHGHESQLILLFQNFIENAIKYNDNEQPIINIICQEKEAAFVIKIEDNGIGISEEYFDRIFEMFTRLHNQEEFQGSGIGLAICQKIAEYHGGTISLESTLDQGSTFIITFPKSCELPSFKIDHAKEMAFELN